jgi:hypothetical protein
MGYKFNEIAGILGIHPVTAGRYGERGKKLIDKDERIWDIENNCSYAATSLYIGGE